MTMTIKTSNTNPFDELCDDTIVNIVSYCDLPSALVFSRTTCQVFRRRFVAGTYHPNHTVASNTKMTTITPPLFLPLPLASLSIDPFHPVWKHMLDRSGCSLEECLQGGAGSTGRSEMLLQELMHRRKLLRNLLQTRLTQAVPAPATLKQSQTTGKAKPKMTIKKQNHCFNLPHRYFYFVPLIPSNWMDYEEDDDDDDEGNNSHNQGGRRIQDQQYLDPPPVLFECDCFCMTSSGTSSEMILQDPFDGSVRVYPSIITDLQQETPMCQSDSSSSSLLWTAMEEEQEFVQAVWTTTTTMKLPMTGPAASVSRVVEWSTTTPIALDTTSMSLQRGGFHDVESVGLLFTHSDNRTSRRRR
jgi:hypothetical protein